MDLPQSSGITISAVAEESWARLRGRNPLTPPGSSELVRDQEKRVHSTCTLGNLVAERQGAKRRPRGRDHEHATIVKIELIPRDFGQLPDSSPHPLSPLTSTSYLKEKTNLD